MDIKKRKNIRLEHFDYSQNGAYFVTVCTKDRKNYFWNAWATNGRPPKGEELTKCGQIVEEAIAGISKHYSSVNVDKYVIMPDHIHVLISIQNDTGRAMRAPTISTIIAQTKGFVSKRLGQSIWQKGFFDHVVRNEHDYQQIWDYIENNPLELMLKMN